MKKKHKKIIRVLSWFVFAAYLVALVYFLFFAEQFGRVPKNEYRFNLVPFQEIRRYLIYWREIGTFNVMINLVGNVVWFLPFGFVLPIISIRQRSLWKIAFLSFLSSLLVELIQLVSKVGTCDVDDIILNTLGGVLGYLLFYFFYRLIRHRDALAKEGM